MSISKIKNLINEHDIKYISFRFSCYKGKWLSVSYCKDQFSEENLKEGIAFDGSSVPFWQDVSKSDMLLAPDLDTVFLDPFASFPTLVIICDVVDPSTGKGYEKDPRNTAKLAQEYLLSTGIGDKVYFGPEPEFFVFDDVRFYVSGESSFYHINSEESFYSRGKKIPEGNTGCRSKIKDSYFNSSPLDSGGDLRSEMSETLKQIGIKPLLHHHEVANSQFEIGFNYDSLLNTADNVQKFKYVIRNVASSYGKTASFMPKPIYGDNGSGMHVHQSIWKDNKPLFAGNKYANLSEMALYYIGGIIKHAKAINAFSNPSTNSYKRLVPGFEAPVILAYSANNRSASIRIPYTTNKKTRRIEVRFPDPAANPYLAFSAMLMAGIDGIKNRISPKEASDRNLYEENSDALPRVSESLKESLNSLDKDRSFLKNGNVFTDSQIDSYLKLKCKEVEKYDQLPHPIEFEEDYNC